MTTSFPMPEDLDDFDEAVGEIPDDSGSAPAVDAPDATVDGEDTTDGGEANSTGTPEAEAFDVNQYGDRVVTVKVNGEDVQVPLSEALQGYQRTADYTQKTQALAERQRQADAFAALQAELERDPKRVIEALSSRYNLNGAPAPDATVDGDGGDVDPKYAAMQQQLASLQQAEEDRQLEATLSGLEARYGDEFDRDEVIQAAVAMGIHQIGQLESVYKAVQHDRLAARLDAQNQHQTQSAADDAARQAAAAAAGEAIGAGASAPPSTSKPSSFNTFEDAFEAAVSAAGGWD